MKIFFLFAIIVAIVMAVRGQRGCPCTLEYAPVCGASGITYGNKCALKCAGDRLKHVGSC